MKIHEAIHLVRTDRYKYFYNSEVSSPALFMFDKETNIWKKVSRGCMSYEPIYDIKRYFSFPNGLKWLVTNLEKGILTKKEGWYEYS